MSFLARFINYTVDPNVVSSFQKACGLKIVSENYDISNAKEQDVSHQCQNSENGEVLNDHSNGNATRVSNGEVPNYVQQSELTKCVQLDNAQLQNVANVQTEESRLKHRYGFVNNKNAPGLSPGTSDWSDTDLKANATGNKKSCVIRTGTIPYSVKNNFLFYLFSFGAGLGNGIFYILFYSFSFWNLDSVITRKVCLLWAICMYIGQATKDIVRVPRPKSPPVVRLETRYELEYGMPSTHAICGTAIPFSLLIISFDRYQEYPVILGIIVACSWCLLVCLSRIYLGMHKILDVIVGVLFAVAMMYIIMPYLDVMDHFLVQNSLAPLVILSAPIVTTFVYPKLETWSTARGDTIGIISICSGCYFGMWLNYTQGLTSPSNALPPYTIAILQFDVLFYSTIRLLFGLVQSVAALFLLKYTSFAALCYILKMDANDPKTKQQLIVELPYKYITNFVVSFNTVYLTPLTFCLLGIQRLSYYSEV